MSDVTHIGEFKLIRHAGRGAFADVWLGVHRAQGYRVAIKLPRHSDTDVARRDAAFLREVRSVARFTHPGIVRIFDFGRLMHGLHMGADYQYPQNAPYCVMEWAERGTLQDALDTLDWPTIRAYLLLILDGLAAAHATGLVHRDIKPDNILLTAHGPKLTDFGIAYAGEVSAIEAERQVIVGTPHYMAPEQIQSDLTRLGPWTDLYAVGCMTYWAVTGRPPFKGKTLLAIAHGHLNEPLPPIEPIFEVPSGLADWIGRLMAKNPYDRYEFAADAALGLARVDAEAQTALQTLTLVTGSFNIAHLQTDTIVDHKSAFAAVSGLPSQPPADDSSVTSFDSARPSDELPEFPSSWDMTASEEPSSRALMGLGRSLFSWRGGRLVGRETERNRLWTALKRAHETSEIELVCLSGVAGLGKSAIARWLTETAHITGVAQSFLMTHESPNLQRCGLPGLVKRILRSLDLPPSLAQSSLTQVCERYGLQSYLGALSALISRERAQPESRRTTRVINVTEGFEAAVQLLASSLNGRAGILVIDDLQWGEEAIGFIEYLQTRWRRLPLLILCTVRADLIDSTHPIAKLLSGSEPGHSVQVLDLGPVPRSELASMVTNRLSLDTSTLNELLERAQGNPLFLELVISQVIDDGRLLKGRSGFRLRSQADIRLPPTIQEIWWHRLSAIVDVDGHIWQSLEIAAVLGHAVVYDEWASVCQNAGIHIDASALETLADAELLVLHPTQFEFQHVLLRDFLVYWARQHQRAKTWHRRAAETLDRTSQRSPERLGIHWLEADRPKQALAYLIDACDHASRVHDYRGLMRLLRYRVSAVRRSGFSLQSHEWQMAINRWHFYLRVTGHADKARHRTSLSVKRCRAGKLKLALSRALVENSLSCAIAGDLESALSSQREACDIAQRLGELELYIANTHGVGKLLVHMRRYDEALEYLNKTIALVDTHQIRHIDKQSALGDLAEIHKNQGRLLQANAYVVQAMELIDDNTPPYRVAMTSTMAGLLALEAGNFAEAQQCLEKARSELKKIGNLGQWGPELYLAEVYAMQDDWQSAHNMAMRAAETVRRFQIGSGITVLNCYFCLTTAFLGRLRAFDEHIEVFAGEHTMISPEAIDYVSRAAHRLARSHPERARKAHQAVAAHYGKLGLNERAEIAERSALELRV